LSARLAPVLGNLQRILSSPESLRRLRIGLIALFAVWGVLALSRLIWALLPAADSALPAQAVVINPAQVAAGPATVEPVDIERLVARHLFGEAGAVDTPPPPAADAASASDRDGIEQGAKETRLELKLRGVVASTENGLGYAIIEGKSGQDIYMVDDKLPVPGQVVLAKVMPTQVVLDNGGVYELLPLFEESELDTQLTNSAPAPPAGRGAAPPGATVIDRRADTSASAVASNYRDRLYQNPQSLANVVRISAVREDGALRGYRLEPGQDGDQFALLGFKPGDLVTSINGIALDDPANTLRLYQAMRSANEAVFELQRDGQPLTVSINLEAGSDAP